MARNYPDVGVSMMPYADANSPAYVACYAKSYWHNYFVQTDVTYPKDLFYDLSNRVYDLSTRRGRNYELGRAEAGEARLRIDNSDGLLTPTNTASPLYGNIKVFKPIYINALHNGTATPLTGNLINNNNGADFAWNPALALPSGSLTASPLQVSANDSNAETSDSTNWYAVRQASPTTLQTVTRQTTYKWQGSYAWERTASGGVAEWVVLDVPVVAGEQYTFSAYTTRSTSTLTMNVWDGSWYAGKTATATTSMTTSATVFTRYSLTWTATSPRATVGFYLPSGTTIRFDGVQVEVGSSATTYTTTGPSVYPLFSGFVERYPQSWQAPNRSDANLVATDTLASMSQLGMTNAYASAVSLLSPLYYYPMNSEEGATLAVNASAYNQAPLSISSATIDTTATSAGTLTFGDSSSVLGVAGAGTTCVNFGYTSTSIDTKYLENTTISDIIFNPIVAGTVTYTFEAWFYVNDATSTVNAFSMYGSDGTLLGTITQTAGTLYAGAGSLTRSFSAIANSWNYVCASVSYTASTGALTLKSKFNASGIYTNTGTASFTDGFRIESGRVTNGKVAHVAIYKGDYTSTASTRYELGTTGNSGLALSTQFSTLFTYAGFNYPLISSETSISYGQPMSWITDNNVFDNAQTLADSEATTWFVAGSGEIVFRNRRYRQTQFTPLYSFSDTGSNYAYQASDVTTNYDPTFVLNDITVTRNGGVVSNAFNDDSVVNYYPRSYDRTIYNNSDLEAIDCAFYLLDRYKEPVIRVESITLTPSRNTDVWVTALDIEIDDLITVTKEQNVDATSVAITGNYFVESISHAVDGQTGDWRTTLTLSPQIKNYNQLGAFDTTLNTSSVVGATTLTLVRGAYSLNDLLSGQMMTIDRANATKREDFVVAGAVTQTSTTLSVPLNKISYTGGSTTGSATPDSISIAVSVPVGFPVSGTALIGQEIVTYHTPVIGVWSLVSRGVNNTIPQPIVSGTPVYGLTASLTSAHTAGVAVNEYLPETNTDGVFYYDNLDTNVLTVTGAGTTTTPASTLAYTALPLSKLPDYNNVPASDFTAGQMCYVTPTGGSAELATIIRATDATSTGTWNAYFYPLGVTRLLSADVDNNQTTITATSTFPLATKAILIDNELMQVVSGTGTATVGVIRGTADSAVWNLANIAPHYNLNQTKTIYCITTLTGLAGSYANGGQVKIISDSVSTPIRLAY